MRSLLRAFAAILAPTFALAFALALLAGPALSGCAGADLFAALPAADQAALRARAGAVPHAGGLVFVARKAGQAITLVGTMHLPDARHAALAAEVQPHLAGARALLVEMGPAQEAEMTAAVAADPSRLFITTGPTIPEMLPEADWQALRAVLQARGMAPMIAAKMKPAFLAVTLSVPPCALEAMARGEAGLDKMLIEAAGARGLPVVALEPWDTAFALFDTMSAQDNADILRMLMLEAMQAESQSVTLANLYFNREARVVWEYAMHRARARGYSEAELARQVALSDEKLVTGRNRAWIPVLEAEAAKGPVLAAFGALHLSGEGGVLALLEARGWAVERLD